MDMFSPLGDMFQEQLQRQQSSHCVRRPWWMMTDHGQGMREVDDWLRHATLALDWIKRASRRSVFDW